ncbi:MAG: hypothetical protein GY782_08565 [Gammaproteobacteria bacterium]|nr:hypothetical protein [Gammaproteobacteria bacterium]
MTFLGFRARIDAIFHKILNPSHNLIWNDREDGDMCPGDIWCEKCNRIYWCRWLDLSNEEQTKRYKKEIWIDDKRYSVIDE